MGKRINLRGRFWRWRIKKMEHPGECQAPWVRKKKILISDALKPGSLLLLDTVVHECLHGCMWDVSEEAVRESATSISKVLYDLGARIELPNQDDI